MKNILVTGGAGYIGSVLSELLLEKGYNVTVFDILRFGGESIIRLLNNNNFQCIRGDVRKTSDMEKVVKGIDSIVHLASIVGDPACTKEPELAKETNLEASKNLYDLANKMGVRKFIFASTCSNYGKMKDHDKYVDEESELAPVSLYAETKVGTENYILSKDQQNKCKPTSLRFSTAYGLSPRMRFDLTVNEFTRDLTLNRELIVFGEQFWRPYCHIRDISNAIIKVIESKEERTAFTVFNVGKTSENYQKQMIVDEIKQVIPEAKIKYVHKDEDPRDYKVSFERIKNILNFIPKFRVIDGIEEIKSTIETGIFKNPDDNRFKNI